MNIAYIIMAHKNPGQIARLVRRLDGPGVTFAIHVDRTKPPVFSRVQAELADMPNVIFARRVAVTWGAYSILHGILNGVVALCEAGADFDYAALLSGQDYPLRPHADISAWLEAHHGQEFMECRPFPRDDWLPDGGYDRVERFHVYLGRRRISFPPRGTSGPGGLVSRLLTPLLGGKRTFPAGYDLYGGSTWWCLSHRAVQYIRTFMSTPEGHRLLNFFKTAQLADEILIHTVLGNSRFGGHVAEDYPWFIDWSENRGSPPVLTLDRFDELAASDALFARKFDVNVDRAVLDRIDRELLGIAG